MWQTWSVNRLPWCWVWKSVTHKRLHQTRCSITPWKDQDTYYNIFHRAVNRFYPNDWTYSQKSGTDNYWQQTYKNDNSQHTQRKTVNKYWSESSWPNLQLSFWWPNQIRSLNLPKLNWSTAAQTDQNRTGQGCNTSLPYPQSAQMTQSRSPMPMSWRKTNSPYSLLALTSFSPSLPTLYGGEVNN
jgi:hypothetical protein